jgi:ketosteroid isomerase-like protein
MSTETEALERFFAAINRNDMQAITKDFDPQIVRTEPEGFPTAGTYGAAESAKQSGALIPDKSASSIRCSNWA